MPLLDTSKLYRAFFPSNVLVCCGCDAPKGNSHQPGCPVAILEGATFRLSVYADEEDSAKWEHFCGTAESVAADLWNEYGSAAPRYSAEGHVVLPSIREAPEFAAEVQALLVAKVEERRAAERAYQEALRASAALSSYRVALRRLLRDKNDLLPEAYERRLAELKAKHPECAATVDAGFGGELGKTP